jgi:hypothetical protein
MRDFEPGFARLAGSGFFAMCADFHTVGHLASI